MHDSTACNFSCASDNVPSSKCHILLAKHGNSASRGSRKQPQKHTHAHTHTNNKHKQRLSISQPLEVYCPTIKHNPIMTTVHVSPSWQLSLSTPLSDVAVDVIGPVAVEVAVEVAVVLASVSAVVGNPELVLATLSAPTFSPATAALPVSDAA